MTTARYSVYTNGVWSTPKKIPIDSRGTQDIPNRAEYIAGDAIDAALVPGDPSSKTRKPAVYITTSVANTNSNDYTIETYLFEWTGGTDPSGWYAGPTKSDGTTGRVRADNQIDQHAPALGGSMDRLYVMSKDSERAGTPGRNVIKLFDRGTWSLKEVPTKTVPPGQGRGGGALFDRGPDAHYIFGAYNSTKIWHAVFDWQGPNGRPDWVGEYHVVAGGPSGPNTPTTKKDPAGIMYQGQFQLFFRGENDLLHWMHATPQSQGHLEQYWTVPAAVSDGFNVIGGSPATTVFNGLLWVFWKTGIGIRYRSYDGNAWSPAQLLPNFSFGTGEDEFFVATLKSEMIIVWL